MHGFFQYELQDTLPVNGSGVGLPQKQIQSGFHFWSEQLNMVYTTLANDGTDDGVCRFSASFRSGANQIALGSGRWTFRPLRSRAVNGPSAWRGIRPWASMWPGSPWFYFYESGGTIEVDLNKIGTTVKTIKFVWTGYLIPVGKVRPDAQAFYAMLANEYPEYGTMSEQRP